MKIIFLDIDGVLNSFEYRKRMGRKYYTEIIDRSKMPLLKRIVDATDAKIVLSTSWRKFWNEGEKQLDSIGEYINTVFMEFGLSVYSKIPVIENVGRGEEILAWLDGKRYIDGYVILDDKNCTWPGPLRAHFIQTDINSDGLEEVQEDSVIKVLNNEFEKTEIYGTTRCSTIKSAFNHMIAIILNCSE